MAAIKVSTGIAEDLAIEHDMVQSYLFVKTDDTKALKEKLMSKVTV